MTKATVVSLELATLSISYRELLGPSHVASGPVNNVFSISVEWNILICLIMGRKNL